MDERGMDNGVPQLKTPSQLIFDDLIKLLPQRQRTAHKGDFGHVLVVGGDDSMGGAVRMAGEAALRVGAGLVTVATRPKNLHLVSSARPELMCHAIDRPRQIKPLLNRATVIVLGPGLGWSSWSQKLFNLVMAHSSVPMVIDADGLNLLAKKIVRRKPWILTPHAGEASRLIDQSSDEIQLNRPRAVTALHEKFGGVCVLKGAGTLIAAETGIYECPYGNPGMATGGMGDVLSGAIGGLLAQHLTLEEAAKLAVCLHAKSADELAIRGDRGILALDLMPELRRFVNGSSR